VPYQALVGVGRLYHALGEGLSAVGHIVGQPFELLLDFPGVQLQCARHLLLGFAKHYEVRQSRVNLAGAADDLAIHADHHGVRDLGVVFITSSTSSASSSSSSAASSSPPQLLRYVACASMRSGRARAARQSHTLSS